MRRTGNEQTGQSLDPYRWLAGVLRGESSAAAGETVPHRQIRRQPVGDFFPRISASADGRRHLRRSSRAGAAHARRRCRCSRRSWAAIRPLRPGCCAGWLLPSEARRADGDEHDGRLSELDEVTRLAGRPRRGRAGQLPAPAAAARSRAGVGGRRLPSRSACLRRRRSEVAQPPAALAPSADHRTRRPLLPGPRCRTGRLRAARPGPREYLAWGATAKVAQLDWAYPTVRRTTRYVLRPTASTSPMILPIAAPRSRQERLICSAILSASQALSSETGIDRLHSRVVEVLSAMTGATGVHLLLWSEDRQVWLLPAPSGNGGNVPVSGSGDDGLCPDVGAAVRPARR